MLFKNPSKVKKAPVREGVPPGQFVTKKLPVLTYGRNLKIDINKWQLKVFGLVDRELELNWEQFSQLEWTAVSAPFHCVTQWSRLENTWEGLLFTDLAKLVSPKPEAKFVMAHCYGDYSTNLPLEVLMDGSSLLAHKHDGKPLSNDHGGPVRLVVPQRYGWKSAKWLRAIEFMAENRPGFWEVRGYHNNGDFWKEERFWPELM